MKRIILADVHILPMPHELDLEGWCERGAEVVEASCETEDDLIAACADASVVVYFGNDLPFTERVLQELQQCLLIQRVAVGFDSVDVAAATRLGILVANGAGYCDEEVANHALAMLLACHQQLPQRQAELHAGRWYVNHEHPTQRLSGQTVGIVGLGRIGSAFSQRIGPLVDRVLAYDPYLDAEQAKPCSAELTDFETVLRESDVVSVHCPLTDETRGMFDDAVLGQMKPSACLVNTARGPIVAQEALYAALVEKRLRGAALDVFEAEPPALPLHALHALPNVITTPHCAAGSPASRRDLWRIASESVASVLGGEVPGTVVNLGVEARLVGGGEGRCVVDVPGRSRDEPSDPDYS